MSYNWKIGMKAVCIDGGRYLKRDTIYSVHGVMTCRCGVIVLDVGVARPDNKTDLTRCYCNASEWRGDWYDAKYFRPLDELEATMDRLEKEGCPTSLPEPVLV